MYFIMYKEVKVKACAKINLTLDVREKREDGYHEISSVMQSIKLHDDLEISAAKNGISLSVISEGGEASQALGHSLVPADAGNIAWKAADLFFKKVSPEEKGVHIRLTKRIPAAAGLAGGSTDAAAVLKGLNELYGTGLVLQELEALGAELGSDVPFCLKGGTVLCTGRGEILEELPDAGGIAMVLAKPAVSVSTGAAYGELDSLEKEHKLFHPDTEALVKALKGGKRMDAEMLAPYLGNSFEKAVAGKHGIIGEIKDALMQCGAHAALMSGSGPSVFGIFPDLTAAGEALGEIRGRFKDVYFCVTEFEEGDRKRS